MGNSEKPVANHEDKWSAFKAPYQDHANKRAMEKHEREHYAKEVPGANGFLVSRAEKMLLEGTLPDNFKNWDIKSSGGHGLTIAHLAAEKGLLPDSFGQWGLKSKTGITVAEKAASSGTLPASFDKWTEGVAKAYFRREKTAPGGVDLNQNFDVISGVVRCGVKVPEEFTNWSLRDPSRLTMDTVAHLAAEHGNLPKNFDQWGLIGDLGDTVAHVAVRMYDGEGPDFSMPSKVEDWLLKDTNGETVLDAARLNPRCASLVAEAVAKIDAATMAESIAHPDAQPNIEARAPEPQAAKSSPEAQAQGGKTNQAAPIETSSTGRITGGGRFSRPPDLSNREPEPERRPIKAFISRGM